MSSTTPVHAHTTATALDLAQRLTRTIEEFRGTHAAVTDTDIRHALRRAEIDCGVSLRRGAISVAMAGLVLACMLVYLLGQSAWGRLEFGTVLASVAFLLAGLCFVYLIARR